MLDDAKPDVRYNAATRLAGAGDARSVPVLVEMLDQEETAGVDAEAEEKLRPFKRALITVNALRAAGQLAQKNSDGDLAPLKQAIEKLLAGDPSPEIRIEAKATLHRFENRGTAPAA
jgi:HEAT repeat protein